MPRIVPKSLTAPAFCMAIWSLLWTLLSCGCSLRKPYPQQPVVSAVELEGERSVRAAPILDGLATTGSQRFLGIWDGVAFEYEVYDPELLTKDLERVERFLQARGYYEAKVVAARVIPIDEHRVRVQIRVSEGAPVLTASITPSGLESVPIEVAATALADSPLITGEPFDEEHYQRSKRHIISALRDAGYAHARCSGSVSVDIAAHQATVDYRVTPGPVSIYGPIRVLGLQEVPESKVRQQLGLVEGARFSESDLKDAQRALLNLNVFTSVQVTPRTDDKHQNEVVPIEITVEEAKLRSVRAGAGLQLDSLQLETHATLGWENKNLFGDLRRFDIDAKPGVILYPTRFGNLVAPDRGLYQHRLSASLRQPSFIEGRTTGFLKSSFSLYPLLYADSDADEGLIGFSDIRAAAGLERAFFEHHVVITPSFNWQLALPVDYRPFTLGPAVSALDELLQDLMIAYPELAVSLDLRDNPLDTRSGTLLSTDLQLASGVFGSDVSDLRVRPEARFYIPISSSVVFATRFTLGFLFASNYGHTPDDDATNFSDAELAQDQQKLLFRGFFSGGPNSNRGYPLRGAGPHGDVRFLSRNIDCSAQPDLRECNRPLGGLTLWESSGEVRFGILGPLRGVTFIDASNVGRSVALDFSAPHLSVGGGLRYSTPIGPVRLDVGYRIPFAQDLTARSPEGDPQDIFGAPIAVHLTLGEAF